MSQTAREKSVPPAPPRLPLVKDDPWLEPYAAHLDQRLAAYQARLAELKKAGHTLDSFSRGYEYFGFNRGEHQGQPGIWYREWAPGAAQLSLVGDFNDWDRRATPLARDEFGVWSVFLADREYGQRFKHGTHLKVHVLPAKSSHGRDHIPAYVRYLEQNPRTHEYWGIYWAPPSPYRWEAERPAPPRSLRIYEAHVGMAVEEERMGTCREFADNILPRIKEKGYNAIQLMAVAEHPYYGSFGYHVSNLYAPCSRFGVPDDYKYLVDRAHALGLVVLMDIVHSHMVKNLDEGLNFFDGTGHQYFHAGGRGEHIAWDSMLYDYSKFEVQRFLLSNIRFWLDEYRFDGYRFDGVTSMLYRDHGLGKNFTCYDDYFGGNVDPDALIYLQLANEVAHLVLPQAITVAEDVSGMVGTARKVADGGLGFDYRMAMGIPDYWIKVLKERKDEAWHMGELFNVLVNRRFTEPHVAYVESHDQALVGDKTIAFWLMDADMYWHMSRESHSLTIARGIALHKMIRLVTFALGGEAYLNFMGNEFGHPEWIDFPREGNRFSHKYARRQWSLERADYLRYIDLARFDRAMLALDERFGLLRDPFIELLQVHEDRKFLAFRRGPLVFTFNFHPNDSAVDWLLGVPDACDYEVILNTDEITFGGYGNTHQGQLYPHRQMFWDGRAQCLQFYLPSRTAQVLAPRR